MIRLLDWPRQFGLEKFRVLTVSRIKWMLVWFGSMITTEMTRLPLGEARKIPASVERTG
jgi:hypothetical protein